MIHGHIPLGIEGPAHAHPEHTMTDRVPVPVRLERAVPVPAHLATDLMIVGGIAVLARGPRHIVTVIAVLAPRHIVTDIVVLAPRRIETVIVVHILLLM